MTPAEPSQKTEVTSHRIAAGGGFRACAILSSAAELARMTGIDTATTTTANPSRNASDARRRVVPPPRGPSTAARSRCSAPAVRARDAFAGYRGHRLLLLHAASSQGSRRAAVVAVRGYSRAARLSWSRKTESRPDLQPAALPRAPHP